MNAMHAIDDYVDLLLTPPEPAAKPPVAPVPADRGPAVPPASSVAQRDPAAAVPVRSSPLPGDEDAAVPAAAPRPLARWLRLRCGDQIYALELLKIREVVLPAPLLPLRGAAPAVRGVMNLRGQVVPVIDLALHFGGDRSAITPATRIIVLEERNEVLGLQVSEVEDIALLDEASVENPRASRLAPVGDQRIRGIARSGGRVMLLLDAARLIATPLH